MTLLKATVDSGSDPELHARPRHEPLGLDLLAPWYIIENPRARLRTLPFLQGLERRTVWYCRLGEPVAKPTDLWGKFPFNLRLPPECKNGFPDHIPAPRGSRTGTQGVGRGKPTAADRAKVPYGLGLTVCLAMEQFYDRPLRVIDLFCGLKGWSRPFVDRGHTVWTTDIEPAFSPDLTIDILFLTRERLRREFPNPDIVLASPPCETFSTMAMGKNWTHQGAPKTTKAAVAERLVRHTRYLLEGK